MSCFLGSSDNKVFMTFQSPFSPSVSDASILVSHIERRSPVCNAVSKESVESVMLESISKLLMRIFEDREPGAVVTDTTLPPNPKEAATGRSSHFGALGKENVEACG